MIDGLFGNGFDDPKSAAIMALAAGLLQRNFAGGLVGANQAYSQAKRGKREEEEALVKMGLLQAQTKNYESEAAQREAANQAAGRKRDALPGLFQGQAVPAAPGQLGSGSMDAVAPAQGQGLIPAGAGQGRFNSMAALLAGYTPDEIQKLAGVPNAGRQEVARTVNVPGPRGEKMVLQLDKHGQPVGQPMTEFEAAQMINLGNRQVAAVPRPGMEFKMGMTPEGADNSARGWAGLNETKRHNSVTESNSNAGRAPQGYRFRQDGSLEAIPGGPADKQSAATADERKAATLLQRLDFSGKQLAAAVQGNPGAAKPELGASVLRGVGLEMAANSVTGTQRQQVDAAQLDMLDAALTLATGAAYTKEQLEGHRKSYFPQIGDDPATVKDKQDRLQNVIQAARIAAGRAASLTGHQEAPGKPQKSVVRTGMYGGRKVIQYSDGSTEYAN